MQIGLDEHTDMKYAIDQFEPDVRAAIAATGRVPAALIQFVTPKPSIPADLAFPTFRVAKELGRSPQEVAHDLAAALQFGPESLVGSVTAAGPYVNVTINAPRLASAVLGDIERLGDRYGHDDVGGGQVVVVDYSSPNVAKRMHVGHIRSTIIGHAVVQILSALGYRTISDNHLGDWGKSFGVLMTAVQHEGLPAGEGEALLVAFERLYATYSSLAERDPDIDREARTWSLRLEHGDPAARGLWRNVVDLTARANQPNYDRLGVSFDYSFGESFYEPMLAGIIQEALDQGVAQRHESGAVVVDLEHGLPSFLLQRSDGGTLYHTRDVATARFRVCAFSPKRIIYVIGEPQDLYLRQLFALVRALGYAPDVELVHVAFGTVFDAEGHALSTRRGNMVYLQALLDEAHARAHAVVDRTSPDLPAHEREEIAEAVGVGAVIYNDVHQNPRRNITLDWDQMLSLEGNSAPYIQYMHARCQSILRRVAQDLGDDQQSVSAVTVGPSLPPYDPAVLTHDAEVELIKCLARLPVVVREAGAQCTPSDIAGWCYQTARALAAFYRDCPVLRAETAELRAARLHVVAAAAQALRNGLRLLGIHAPDRL